MIRQAINCDICGAEKLEATSHWFVAYEQGGELKLRGWESPKNSRKNVKHLCGQKCVQHLTANFTAAVMAGEYATKGAKEELLESTEQGVDDGYDAEETPILERMGYNRETAALIEAESWAGPAKPKAISLEPVNKQKIGRETLINAARLKVQTARSYQHNGVMVLGQRKPPVRDGRGFLVSCSIEGAGVMGRLSVAQMH